MRLFIIIFSLCFSLSSVAQTDSVKKPKAKFQSAIQFGIMEGQAGTSLQLQTINGLKYKTFSLGIGVGIDYYEMRSIPLFLNVTKDIFYRSKTPFIYTDIGTHFPWLPKFSEVTNTSPGLFYDLGLGYKFPTKSNAITVSAGYSFKAYSYETTQPYWCTFGPCPEITNHYDLKLRRLSVKAGYIF